MKRAFTLIELLVVIAIIAILAAILFPVFAQAKEAAKKTTTLSNAKQQGTSLMLYSSDADDCLPSATLVYGGTWNSGYIVPTPADAITSWNTDALKEATNQFWANSTQPYRKSYGILEGGPNKVTLAGDSPFNTAPAPGGLTMNGFMQLLSSSEIPYSSNAVLLWGGFGNTTLAGRTGSVPELQCAGVARYTPCRFNPGAMPSGAATGTPTYFYNLGQTSFTPWTWGKTVPIVRADTSAKSRRVGSQENASAYNYDVWNDPYAYVAKSATTGWSRSYFPCNTGNDDDSTIPVFYWCFFRPDREK